MPIPDKASLERSTLCLIRHGTTAFNMKMNEVITENGGFEGEAFRKLKADK